MNHRRRARDERAGFSVVAVMAFAGAGPRVLVNHVGYDARGSKKLIVESAKATGFDAFQVIGADGRVVLERTLWLLAFRDSAHFFKAPRPRHRRRGVTHEAVRKRLRWLPPTIITPHAHEAPGPRRPLRLQERHWRTSA